jgi:hypothetical protein
MIILNGINVNVYKMNDNEINVISPYIWHI